MSDKRIVIRILFEKLDMAQAAALLEALEAVAEEYGEAETELTVLPSMPSVG